MLKHLVVFLFIIFFLPLYAQDSAREASDTKQKMTMVEKAVQKIKDSFSTMANENIKNLLMERIKGSPLEPVMKKFPKLYDFFAGFLKSDEAMKGFSNIATNRGRLINFGLCMLVTFIIAFIARKRDYNLRRPMISSWFKRFCIFTPIRLGFVYYFFSEDLSPIVKLFKETMLT